MEHIMECSICLEVLNKDEGSCETPCCFKTFHKEKCIGLWVTEKKKCPMCRARIRSKVLLFPIKLRTLTELKEDIAIEQYRSIREPNRKKFLENIRERNEDTVYIDELEDEIEDDDNDGMPGLEPYNPEDDDNDGMPGLELVPYNPEFIPEYSIMMHGIGFSSNYISDVLYFGLQLPAVNSDYDANYDAIPELVPYNPEYSDEWHRLSSNYISDDSAVPYLRLQLPDLIVIMMVLLCFLKIFKIQDQ